MPALPMSSNGSAVERLRGETVQSRTGAAAAAKKSLELFAFIYNEKKGSPRDREYQFTFLTDEAALDLRLVVENRKCRVEAGRAENPVWWVETDVETLGRIAGGYSTGAREMKAKRFVLKKELFKFLATFGREFGGHEEWESRPGTYTKCPAPEKINRVLILSCSSRARKGATELFVERFKEGMVQAGAAVEVLHPAKMNIRPCDGCFACWLADGQCVHDDDMSLYFEKFERADMVMIATPIYFYHGTTALKTLMDRWMSRNHHSIAVRNGFELHPQRDAHCPHLVLAAFAGLGEMRMFSPLVQTIEMLSVQKSMPLAAVLRRPTAMGFLIDDYRIKAKEDILDAAVRAGRELVTRKKVGKKTKKQFEQPVMPRPMLISSANFYLEKAVSQGFPFMMSRRGE